MGRGANINAVGNHGTALIVSSYNDILERHV